MDGRSAAEFDVLDHFIVRYGLDLAVAAEATALSDTELARRLVAVETPRAARLARVVGLLDGKGGGSPEFAQGAGPKVEALGDAIEAARREVRTLLTSSG